MSETALEHMRKAVGSMADCLRNLKRDYDDLREEITPPPIPDFAQLAREVVAAHAAAADVTRLLVIVWNMRGAADRAAIDRRSRESHGNDRCQCGRCLVEGLDR